MDREVRSGSERSQGAGIITILAFLVLCLGAGVLRLASATIESYDLKPRPDALEYAVGAKSIVDHGRYEIPLGSVALPARYPPGTSLLFAPFVAIGGPESAWYGAWAFGCLAVLFAGLLGHLVGGPPAALAAALLIATSPAAVTSSTLAMSESASTWFAAIALLAAAGMRWRVREDRLSERGRNILLLGGAFACGLATLVRYTNLALVIPLAVVAWARGATGKRSYSHVLVALLPSLIALALVALRNTLDFGSPWIDGYRYWVPELYGNRDLVFSLAYLVKPLAELFPSGNLVAYGSALAGYENLFYAWPAAALALLGFIRNLVLCRRCPVARTMTIATFTTAPAILGFYLLYAWQDTRFLEPLLPLIAALVASGAVIARDLLPAKPRTGNLLAVVIAAIAIVPGVLPRLDRITEKDVGSNCVLDGYREVAQRIEPNSVLIVDQPAAFVYGAVPTSVELVSVDLDASDPHLSRVLRHGLKDRDGRSPSARTLCLGPRVDESTFAAIDDWLAHGRPIYRLTLTEHRALSEGEKHLAARYESTQTEFVPVNFQSLQFERLLKRR